MVWIDSRRSSGEERVDMTLGLRSRVTERRVGIKTREVRTWSLSGVGDHEGRELHKVVEKPQLRVHISACM